MRLALIELRRKPGRFGVVTVALALIVVLLLLLGGLLDGLFLNSTGAIRAQQADVVVFSSDARDSLLRSRIDGELRSTIEGVDGVTDVGGLGVTLLGVRVPGQDEIADGAVFGYELPPSGVPEPAGAGRAWVDERLVESGVEEGMTVEIGPARTPLEVAGFVEDTNYLGQNSLWVDPATWRAVQNANRPDAFVRDDVFQVLVASADDLDAEVLADRIDEATAGRTSTLTLDETVESIPGVKEQRSTFAQIIYTTLFVGGLVIALFFALLTLERIGLYGTLKALGSSSRQLFTVLAVQAVAVAVLAFLVGAAVAFALSRAVPPEVPLQLEPSRAVTTFLLLIPTAFFGGAISLRRIIRIDPASAIGRAS